MKGKMGENGNGKGSGKENIVSFYDQRKFDCCFFLFITKIVKNEWREQNGEKIGRS